MFFEAAIIFFTARYLRKVLYASPKLAEWDNRLRLAWIAGLVLLGIGIVFPILEHVARWTAFALSRLAGTSSR